MRSLALLSLSLFTHNSLSLSLSSFTHTHTHTYKPLSLSLHKTPSLSFFLYKHTHTHRQTLSLSLLLSLHACTLSSFILLCNIPTDQNSSRVFLHARYMREATVFPLSHRSPLFVCVCVCVFFCVGSTAGEKKACAFLERGAVAINDVKNKRSSSQNYWALSS